MASSKAFLEYVLDQLSPLAGVKHRQMMGEYLICCRGAVIGGVYDDRFLIKPSEGALRVLRGAGREPEYEIPYPGAKPMLAADIDNGELTRAMVCAAADDVPPKKPRRA